MQVSTVPYWTVGAAAISCSIKLPADRSAEIGLSLPPPDLSSPVYFMLVLIFFYFSYKLYTYVKSIASLYIGFFLVK